MNNKHLWIATKLFSVLFNSFSTWTVFFAVLKQSIGSSLLAGLGTFCAVMLVDVLFVALIGRLEADYSEEEVYEVRWAYVIGLVTLYASIVAIGFLDEGIMAIAPRIGLGIIAMISVLQFVFNWRSYQDAHWQERFEKRNERLERKDQKELSKKLRKIKNEEQYNALILITEELTKEYAEKHRRQLLTTTGTYAKSMLVEGKSTVIAETLPLPENFLPVKALASGITMSDDSKYAWSCEHCGYVGKAATEHGAKVARSRHTNSCDR
jgi:hypothetical protein